MIHKTVKLSFVQLFLTFFISFLTWGCDQNEITEVVDETDMSEDGVATVINQVDLNSLTKNVEVLVGESSVVINGVDTTISNRINDHEINETSNVIVGEFLKQQLTEYGLDPVSQKYSEGGENIYAIQKGTKHPDEYFLISAHYDAVDYYCADDNASGTATVLEAAKILSHYDFDYSIIYAFWDEEELGLVGSKYFSTEAAMNNLKINGVINLDMIAWDGDEDMIVEIHSATIDNSNQLAIHIYETNDTYEIGLEVNVEFEGTNRSDHGSFWDTGYSAVLIIEEFHGGDLNPHYHTAKDRMAILDLPYYHRISKLAIGALASKAVISK